MGWRQRSAAWARILCQLGELDCRRRHRRRRSAQRRAGDIVSWRAGLAGAPRAAQGRTVCRHEAAPDTVLANIPVPQRELQALCSYRAGRADRDRGRCLAAGDLRAGANRKPLVRMKGAISAPRLPGDRGPYCMVGRLHGWRTAAERICNASPGHLGAFGHRALTPGVKSLIGPLHNARDLFRFEKRELPYGIAGVRVDRRERAGAGIAVRPGRCAFSCHYEMPLRLGMACRPCGQCNAARCAGQEADIYPAIGSPYTHSRTALPRSSAFAQDSLRKRSRGQP
jgi:hypothetical protein